MLEALIGMLLIGIVGLGMSYAAARAVVSQRQLNASEIAITQMRNLLQRYGTALCDDTSLAVITLPPATSLDLTVSCSTASASVNGTSVSDAPSSVTLSATSADGFGGSGTIVVGDLDDDS
ncbi:hypothetical protein [Solimonas marina]|uniref:Uncharacterized protein n=1 Tax=Solimonas marina TaxID=2714601 RepID=A0A970B8A1_9GAMM|nr:hypothetical protein [Solimonas marina]NKF21171.1 hypothetical protein [Solimonas marina]